MLNPQEYLISIHLMFAYHKAINPYFALFLNMAIPITNHHGKAERRGRIASQKPQNQFERRRRIAKRTTN